MFPITKSTMAYLLPQSINKIAKKGANSDFSGVSAQHQNARSERANQTVTYMDRNFMAHASLNWCQRRADNIFLWYFSVKHYIWIYNQLPSK